MIFFNVDLQRMFTSKNTWILEWIMLCWILHGYFPCSFSSHPRLHPSHQLVGCVVLTYCVQNKCPFKKFKLPECNLVLLTDIWPERKISHRINKVDQDQVKQQQSKREKRGRLWEMRFWSCSSDNLTDCACLQKLV